MNNFKNYYIYADAVRERQNIEIYVPSITMNNIDDHIQGIYALLKDGIETDYEHNLLVNISWGGDLNCDLFIVDYWFNLFMWRMILKNGNEVRPKHIFFSEELKVGGIAEYVNEYVLTRENKIRLGNEFLNENLYDSLWSWSYVESFAFYLANTINNEDNINLMKACPEFNDMIHSSFIDLPIEEVKDAGMKNTYKAIDIIKNSKKYLGYYHGQAAPLKASQGINPKQFRESQFNIGPKPNGSDGGVFPYIIDTSYANGGVNNPLYYTIECSSARYAQILSKINVGTSGDFARLLGLNCMDVVLNPDMNYDCGTSNFIKFEIKTKKHLSMIKNRYYKVNTPYGYQRSADILVDEKDESLIGKTIYMRSPMMCASHAAGRGICRKCYGDLYFTNRNIVVGKYATEELSSQLTQRLLSAKHLLEVAIIMLTWNAEFKDWFFVDTNIIYLQDMDINLKKYQLLIDPSDMSMVSDDENSISADDGNDSSESVDIYNEYITYFIIKTPEGQEIKFGTNDSDPLYLSTDLNNIIRKKAIPDDGMVNISLSALADIPLFFVRVNNNEMSKVMNDIKALINKSSALANKSADEAAQTIIDLVVEGGLAIDAVHLETIFSEQISVPNNTYEKPDWTIPGVPYSIFTLNHALTNNKSVVKSLLYKDLHKTFYNPLTYTKNAPSFFDMFFCEQPQLYMDDNFLTKKEQEDVRIPMCKIVK